VARLEWQGQGYHTTQGLPIINLEMQRVLVLASSACPDAPLFDSPILAVMQ